MSAKSLLFTGDVPYVDPAGCGPGRTEVDATIRKNGRLYRVVVRDKIAIEDPYLVMVKATAFAIRTGEPYQGENPTRALRDFLIKSNVII
jgi:hypothetical protein